MPYVNEKKADDEKKCKIFLWGIYVGFERCRLIDYELLFCYFCFSLFFVIANAGLSIICVLVVIDCSLLIAFFVSLVIIIEHWVSS